MADSMIDPAFIATVTGVDTATDPRVFDLIGIAEGMMADVYGGTLPATPTMTQRVTLAQFVAGALVATPDQAAIRSEQVGDYRVEYVGGKTVGGLSIDVLRRMLSASLGKNYSTQTFDKVYVETDDPWSWLVTEP